MSPERKPHLTVMSGSAPHGKPEYRPLDPQRVEEARAELRDGRTFDHLADTFSALADANRVKICYSLVDSEMCVSDLAFAVGISESAASQHLRILRNMRWVRSRKDGRMVLYFLEDEHIKTLLKLSLTHARDL